MKSDNQQNKLWPAKYPNDYIQCSASSKSKPNCAVVKCFLRGVYDHNVMKCVNKSDIERMTGSQLAELIMGPGELREPLNEQQVEALLNVQKLDRVPLESNPIVVENERGLTGLIESEGRQEAQSHQLQNSDEHQSDQQQQTNQQPDQYKTDEVRDSLPDQVVTEISQENSDTSSSADHTPNGNSNVERDDTNIEESRVAVADAISLGVQPDQPHQQSEFDFIVHCSHS